MTDLAVGDYVYCRHAEADGVVTEVYEFNLHVRVVKSCNVNYTVGAEYAWLPMQVQRIPEPVLN